MQYQFKAVLKIVSELTDGDALFEAGCNDGTIVSRDGNAFVRFSRESDSLEDAITSAAGDVRKAGFHVAHVEVACPV
jgi:hypothetical protein